MGSMDELRSPSLPTSPAAPIIVFPLPSMLSVLQLLGTIRCPEKPRAAHNQFREWHSHRNVPRTMNDLAHAGYVAGDTRDGQCIKGGKQLIRGGKFFVGHKSDGRI